MDDTIPRGVSEHGEAKVLTNGIIAEVHLGAEL